MSEFHPDLALVARIVPRFLFRDEDVAYAKRLEAAGVLVELELVPGVFHGLDMLRRASVTKAFHASWVAALRRALA